MIWTQIPTGISMILQQLQNEDYIDVHDLRVKLILYPVILKYTVAVVMLYAPACFVGGGS